MARLSRIAPELPVADLRAALDVAVHIFTPDLEDLHAELQSSGALISQGIIRKPWGNRDFRVKDASGNELKFTEARGGRVAAYRRASTRSSTLRADSRSGAGAGFGGSGGAALGGSGAAGLGGASSDTGTALMNGITTSGEGLLFAR